MFSKLLQLGLLASFVCAVFIPTYAKPSYKFLPRAAGNSAASIILQIAPTSNSCDNPPYPGECATNTEASQPLIDSFERYGITNTNEMAAVMGLIAFESGDFKANINHVPGKAGQGTRNMMYPQYVLEYAQSFPELSSQISKITAGSSSASLSDDQLNAVRALVLPDQYSFGSAAWFLTTQCASIRPQLQTGTQAGFEAYMGCIGTTVTDARLAYWTAGIAAFKPSSK
ncbi:hypothetical protein G7Y89_g1548 [Cudoniella acicularis]|uniref:Uncharacterized protein n=1 Tax=Cudoniella acicularis TaxID=354080 RepID=A0A8H4W6W7_9HELO|nr:hypothetical protein G7Y89_g1548 [Cudoniella acicularis]